MDRVLIELVEFVKNAAPAVWAIAVRQVYVRAWMNLAVSIVALVLFIVSSVYTKKLWLETKDLYYSEKEPLLAITVSLAIVTFLIFIFCGLASIPYFINPQYYAIQVLLELVQ